jgi:hypothetical protein
MMAGSKSPVYAVALFPTASDSECLIPNDGIGRAARSRTRASMSASSSEDAPDAFGSMIEEVAAWPAESWSKQLLDLPTFIAVSDGLDVGLVRCARDEARSDMAWLISTSRRMKDPGRGYANLTQFLRRGSLKGAQLGVVRDFLWRRPTN